MKDDNFISNSLETSEHRLNINLTGTELLLFLELLSFVHLKIVHEVVTVVTRLLYDALGCDLLLHLLYAPLKLLAGLIHTQQNLFCHLVDRYFLWTCSLDVRTSCICKDSRKCISLEYSVFPDVFFPEFIALDIYLVYMRSSF